MIIDGNDTAFWIRDFPISMSTNIDVFKPCVAVVQHIDKHIVSQSIHMFKIHMRNVLIGDV